MTIESLKEYIFKEKKIEHILEAVGCSNIKYNEQKGYYSASAPDGDNPQGVNILDNKYLNYRSFSRNVSLEDNRDLISFVQETNGTSFIDTVKYVCSILGIEFKGSFEKPKQKKDYSNILGRYRSGSVNTVNVKDIEVLEDEFLDEFIPILHIDWYREGVMPWTRKKFGITYSYKKHRIIVPMRHWKTGKLLGINARTTIKNYKELGITKFFITPSYKKGLNLFGAYENMNAIKKAGYVVVYEAEKSVLKRDSLNDSTGVALSGHTITSEQVRILIDMNVDIIIALDKDVSLDETRDICEKFFNVRNVYYIWDKHNLLGEHDSPADAPKKIYDYLFKWKVKYDAVEHKKYEESLKKV